MFKADRVQAFSDGMFSILITILVLEFNLPNYRTGHLLTALLEQWPIMLAYTISFAYIGTLWLFHHDFFSIIGRVNPTLNIINLLILFSVTLINYPTSLIAETLAVRNNDDMRLAIILYDLAALFISFTFEILYMYVRRHPELKKRAIVETEEETFIRSDPIISVLIYLVSILMSFFSVLLGIFLLLAGIIWHTIAYYRLYHKVASTHKRAHLREQGEQHDHEM